ncbi:MAG: hypothetical protein ACRENE_17140 [Polyangiaceae bacterium]
MNHSFLPSPAHAAAWLLAVMGAVANAACAEEAQEIIAIPGLPPGRLRGLVYYIAPETRWLPDFSALAPVAAICLD